MQITHNEPIFTLDLQNGSDDIASASYYSAPTKHQQFMWRRRMLHTNELHCAVPKLSFTRSIFVICHSIQLH
jgi:hypothetical protein